MTRISKRSLWPAAGLALVLALVPALALGRENVVQGNVTLENDYDSNVFSVHSNRTEEWNTLVSPELTLHSTGVHDSLDLRYAPEWSYNHRRNDNEITQEVSLDAARDLSERWRVGVNGDYSYYDNLTFEQDHTLDINTQIQQMFIRADDATQAEVVRLLFPELNWDPALHMPYVITHIQDRYNNASPGVQQQVRDLLVPVGGDSARQRYWDSSVGINSTYEFAKDSTLTLAYTYEQHDNRTEQAQADRETHQPSIAIDWRINNQWRIETGYDFTWDRFDTSDNSQTDNPFLQLDFTLSPNASLYWKHDYSKVSYDAGSNDSTDQTSTLGWDWDLDQVTKLESTLDVEYLDNETSADERSYTLEATGTRTFERGSASLTAEGIYGEGKNGPDWWKQRRSWELSTDVSYQLGKDLSSSFDASYGEWQTWFDGESTRYNRLETGADVTYDFMRYFSFTVEYRFKHFETTGAGLDDFNEHTVNFKLSAAGDLVRW